MAAFSPTASTSRLRTPLLLAAALAAVVGALSTRDLWAPDEPRYGEVAREMLQTGDLLVPRVNAEPYAEKPPVWYWWATLLSVPGGEVTSVTARLASALLAAGAVLLTARLGTRLLHDADAGTTAALLFATSGLVLWNAPRAGLDLPLTFFVLLAIERGVAWAESGSLVAAVLAGVAWAAAVLTKGPVGFFLPPLVLGAFLVARRGGPSWRNAGWWIQPLLLVGLCLLWLLPASAAGGEAYAHRLLGQIGSRATGREAGHVRGPFYYVLRAVPFLLPWTLQCLAGLVLAWRLRLAERPKRVAAITAAVGSIGFLLILSVFGTKRELYMIPGIPFAVLLAAWAIHRDETPRLLRLGRILAILCLAGAAFVSLLLPWGLGWAGAHLGVPGLTWPSPMEVLVSVAGALGLVLLALTAWRVRERPLAPVHLVAVGLLLGGALVQVAWLPKFDGVKSFARVAAAADRASGGGPIAIAGWDQAPNLLWDLPERRHVDTLSFVQASERLKPGAPAGAVVAEKRAFEAELAGARAARPEEASVLEGATVRWQGRVGNRRLLVLVPPEPGVRGP